MSWENLIFFVLVLVVWGISVAGRWLQEQMAKTSTDGREFEPIEWTPAFESEGIPQAETLVPPEGRQEPRPSQLSLRNVRVSKKNIVRRLGLGSPQTLRQGIILMTVLGPCRALEPTNHTRPFS